MAVHGRHTRVLIDKYDMTRIFSESSRTNSKDEADVTTFGVDDREYEAGFKNGAVNLTGNFDTQRIIDGTALTADAALDAAFDDADSTRLLAIGHHLLDVGKRVLLFFGDSASYDITSPVNDKVGITATFSSRQTNAIGISLLDYIARNATLNGPAQDNAASSANGGIAQLHIPANTRNGTVDVKVQHSVDNSVWVDLATFTQTAAATLRAERITVAGTVQRYLRAVVTIAGTTGTVTVFVGFARLV